jgi:hypothetical protein
MSDVRYWVSESISVIEEDVEEHGTAINESIGRLEWLLGRVRQQWDALTTSEVPEVFDLPPLSRRRVTARVRQVEPARFYFVADDDAGQGAKD